MTVSEIFVVFIHAGYSFRPHHLNFLVADTLAGQRKCPDRCLFTGLFHLHAWAHSLYAQF